MPHDTPLIATIVAGLGLAFIFGALAHRLKAPPLIGYLLAGVAVGPHTPGFVADQALGSELAEIGVILLMFGVGLHFSLKDLLSVKAIAVPGAIVQIAWATLLGLGLALLLGWSVPAGLVFGLALSVASTVVLLKALQERRLVETERGRIAVGWLIVEDLAMVLALVIIPALGGLANGSADSHGDPLTEFFGGGLQGVLIATAAKVGAFVATMLIVGRRLIPWVLHWVAHGGSRELFRLAVLAIALGVAFGAAKLFGVSLALGAFFAGMILAESALSQRAAQESLPLRDAFSVLFFVSVGMLFDPLTLIHDPLPVLAVLLIILLGKSMAAYLIVVLFRHPPSTALIISASLAQIGEFSFILAEMGVGLNILPERGRDLILAGAILSILLNPVAFAVAGRLAPRREEDAKSVAGKPGASVSAEATPASPAAPATAPVAAEETDLQPTTLAGHTILVGYGRVGRFVGQELKRSGESLLAVEDEPDLVRQIRADGIEALSGNGADPAVLAAANLAGASRLVVAIPEAFEAGQIVSAGRAARADLTIIVRAHSREEVEHLTRLGASAVVMAEDEVALGILARLRAAEKAKPVPDAVAG